MLTQVERLQAVSLLRSFSKSGRRAFEITADLSHSLVSRFYLYFLPLHQFSLTLSGRAAAPSGQRFGTQNASRPLTAANTTDAYGAVANKKHT